MKTIIEIEKEHVEENKSKHSNDIEPTLYSNKMRVMVGEGEGG
jgi:hypothetical protein